MDSMLVGSNIAWCTRYEIVQNTLGLFCKTLKNSTHPQLTKELRSQLKEITETESRKVIYRLNREEVQRKLQSLDLMIYKLLSVLEEKDNKHYLTLKRVFEEQFRVNADQVKIQPKDEIKSNSIQSPHDTDCTYCNKDGQQVKGYSANVTEPCFKHKLNLIVIFRVSPINTSDVEFFGRQSIKHYRCYAINPKIYMPMEHSIVLKMYNTVKRRKSRIVHSKVLVVKFYKRNFVNNYEVISIIIHNSQRLGNNLLITAFLF
jgi:hypothetical protein